jgi:hypothetical protein
MVAGCLAALGGSEHAAVLDARALQRSGLDLEYPNVAVVAGRRSQMLLFGEVIGINRVRITRMRVLAIIPT